MRKIVALLLLLLSFEALACTAQCCPPGQIVNASCTCSAPTQTYYMIMNFIPSSRGVSRISYVWGYSATNSDWNLTNNNLTIQSIGASMTFWNLAESCLRQAGTLVGAEWFEPVSNGNPGWPTGQNFGGRVISCRVVIQSNGSATADSPYYPVEYF